MIDRHEMFDVQIRDRNFVISLGLTMHGETIGCFPDNGMSSNRRTSKRVKRRVGRDHCSLPWIRLRSPPATLQTNVVLCEPFLKETNFCFPV